MHTFLKRQVWFVIGSLIVMFASCRPAADGRANSDAKSNNTSPTPQIELTGTVVRMPWTKSPESWDAGGSEYYVIVVDGPASLERRMILRPSERIAFEEFAKFAGQRVHVVGHEVLPQPYVPNHPGEQYLMGRDGRPALRGGGFKVFKIVRLDLRD